MVCALVGRDLGIITFGQLSLALACFYLSQVCAVAGLGSFIIRSILAQ